MYKKISFYLVSFVLLIVILWLFNSNYRQMTRYSALTDRAIKVRSIFQELSQQITNAAVLNPDLLSADNSPSVKELFFADRKSIIRQLDLLRSTVIDTVNIRIAEALNIKVRADLSWIISSNVPDSIIQHKSSKHIASLVSIDSLINKGIQRTIFLLDERKQKENDAYTKVKIWIIAFCLISGILLIYTTAGFFNQQSRRKRKEKELETVLNRISDGVVSVDNLWRYTFLNDAALATHPFSKKETIGKVIWDVHPQMKGTVFWDKYHEAMLTRKVAEIESYYAPMQIWFSVKVYPSSDGLTIFYKDVTESKRSEQELEKAQNEVQELNRTLIEKVAERTLQLENANKELEAFSYSVSHDLRAPLRIIDGYSDIVMTDYADIVDDEGKRVLGIIRKNTLKMGQLIDELLNLSNLGRKKMILEKIDMNMTVNTVIKDLNLAPRSNIVITIDDLLPATCDRGLIENVWSNLISNAVKYSGKREKSLIHITSEMRGDEIVYCVKDNGAGFDMKYAGKLFGVFQRLHKATDFEGTGIGLALVKRIVARNKGTVWAEGEENKGAVFYFTLPV